MISLIRNWVFNKSMKKHPNYNNKSHSGVNSCKTICIIANGTDSRSKSSVEQYKLKLETLGKTIDVLYFIDKKEESDFGYSRQAIKWSGVPENQVIDATLSNQYDLLIFLSPTMENHFIYLATLCNAKLKIGPDNKDNNNIFDIIIDIKDYTDTGSLIKNIDKQLRMLSI